MAERMNIAYFSETEEILWGERWGGNSIWEYIIYGADYIIDIVKDPKFLTSKLETGLDGAMLIDASQKNVIFDAKT